jgi:hypothetical protein
MKNTMGVHAEYDELMQKLINASLRYQVVYWIPMSASGEYRDHSGPIESLHLQVVKQLRDVKRQKSADSGDNVSLFSSLTNAVAGGLRATMNAAMGKAKTETVSAETKAASEMKRLRAEIEAELRKTSIVGKPYATYLTPENFQKFNGSLARLQLRLTQSEGVKDLEDTLRNCKEFNADHDDSASSEEMVLEDVDPAKNSKISIPKGPALAEMMRASISAKNVKTLMERAAIASRAAEAEAAQAVKLAAEVSAKKKEDAAVVFSKKDQQFVLSSALFFLKKHGAWKGDLTKGTEVLPGVKYEAPSGIVSTTLDTNAKLRIFVEGNYNGPRNGPKLHALKVGDRPIMDSVLSAGERQQMKKFLGDNGVSSKDVKNFGPYHGFFNF